MKRNCITFLICTLLSVLAADAATVYFQNTKNWNAVYAYTWSPSDDVTALDALKTVAVKDKDGNDMTLYYKITDKDNILFLNKSSFLSKDKDQTVGFKVVDNAVYTGNSAQIGKVVDVDGVLTFQEEDPVEYESGVFLSWGNTADELTNNVEFAKDGSIYTIGSLSLTNRYFRITVTGASGEETYIGPTENMPKMIYGDNLYDVSENSNVWKGAGANYNIVYNSELNQVAVNQNSTYYWGVFRSDAGVWGTPTEFSRVVSTELYPQRATIAAGGDSQFAVFRSYGSNSWNSDTRYMPASEDDTEVTGDYSGTFTAGSTAVWLLDNEVPFGTWTVEVNWTTKLISFTRNVQAIIVNGKPAELTDGSWSGALVEDDVVDFNIDGTYYVLGELTQKQEGTNLIYTTTLVEGRDKEISFSADDATITVDGLNVTITATGAFKPQMTVGAKTIDLAQSGNFLVAYGVDITNDDAISFSINGKNYIPEMPESIKYEAFSVTLPLKEEDGSVTFADVKGTSGKTPFITDTFTPNIRVKDDASAVTFIWDVETGVEAVEDENDCVATYYNLQGVRVSNPENGLYIKVVDGKATKVRL